MSNTVAELINVDFRRADKHILRQVSWRIDKNQHWALLGANGSGKTMLLKLITGYQWPSSGTVSVLGQTFGSCDIPTLRKTVGYFTSAIIDNIPHSDTSLDVVLSGIDSSFGLYRNYTPEQTESALGLLKDIGAADYTDRPFAILSQGERQRILIARSLICQPKLLILDEPCVGLDPVAREKFLADISAFTKLSDTPSIIFVTHHIEEIGPWITHANLLKDGTILAQGPTNDVINSASVTELFSHPCEIELIGNKFKLTVKETD